MHSQGLPEQGISADDLYHGASLLKHLPTIHQIATKCGAKSLLDYGSGKGRYYEARDLELISGEVVPSIQDYLEVASVRCYDPAVAAHNTLPEDKFDIVISTDALEHCPESDIPWIVEEIFGFARKAVYANVASYPAKKILPSGENAHATQQPASWWDDLLKSISKRHPGVAYHFEIEEMEKSLFTLFKLRKRKKNLIG